MMPWRDRRGTTALEFALVLPSVAILLFGMFDIGRLAAAQYALDRGVQKAARYAIVNSASATTTTIKAQFNTAVSPILGTCSGCSVSVSYTPSYAPGNTVTISVSYSWSPLVGLTQMASQTLSAATTLTVQN